MSKLKALILAGGLTALPLAAQAESKLGLEFRWNFSGSPTLGLTFSEVNYRDVKKSSTSISSSYIDAAPSSTFNDVVVGVADPELPQVLVGDTVSLEAYQPDDNRITDISTSVRKTSDDISGYTVGFHFPINNNWKHPTIELRGLTGKIDSFAELGLGYDFQTEKLTVPVSYGDGHFKFGTNLRAPLESSYLALNSQGEFEALDKLVVNNSTTSEQLCTGGENEYLVFSRQNGMDVNYEYCNNF